jgi:hypothetical protein
LLARSCGFKVVGAFVKFFSDIFSVGIWQATKNLGWTVMQAVYGIFKPVLSFLWSLGEDIIAPFKWLYNILVGNSIIPDLCTAIVGFFGKMAMKAIKFVAGIPGKVLGGLYNVFIKGPVSLLKKGAGFVAKVAKSAVGFVKDAAKNPGVQNVMKKMMESTFLRGPIKVFNKMFKFLNTKALRSGLGIVSERFGTFFNLFKGNISGLTKFFTGSWYSFLNTASGGLFGKMVDAVRKSKIGQIVEDFLIKPIASGLEWIGRKAGDIFGWLKNKAGSAGRGGKNLLKGIKEFLGFGKASAAKGADEVAKAAAKGTGKVADKLLKTGADDAVKVATKAAEGVVKTSADDMATAATKAAATKTGTVAASADDLAKVSTGVTKTGVAAAAAGADDLVKAVPAALGFIGKTSSLIGGIAKKLPVVGPLIDFGIRKVTGQSTGKAVAGTASGVAGGLAGAAAGAAIGTMIFPGVGTAIGGLLGGVLGGMGAGMASDIVYDKVVGTGSGSEVIPDKAAQASLSAVESKSLNVATPVGQHAIPVVKPEDDVSDVQPVHLRDISQTMLRDRASTNVGSRQLHSDELTRIQEASDEQVYELQRIREAMENLASYMKPTGATIGSSETSPGSTRDPRRPLHAALYGRRKYSQPGGNAARALVNDGEV